MTGGNLEQVKKGSAQAATPYDEEWFFFFFFDKDWFFVFWLSRWLYVQRSFFFFFFLLCHIACRLLVPRPGIKPMPSAVEVRSLNHWTTREVPHVLCLFILPLRSTDLNSEQFCLPCPLLFPVPIPTTHQIFKWFPPILSLSSLKPPPCPSTPVSSSSSSTMVVSKVWFLE